MAGLHIRLYDPAKDTPLLPAIGQIHRDGVLTDGQAISLLPPVTDEKLQHFWTQMTARIPTGEVTVILAFADDDRASEPGGRQLAGYVCLVHPPSETGPFRAWVQKLIVSLAHRRRGVARALLERLEEEALMRQRTLLLLDTSIGGGADTIYPRLGYTEYGRLPEYAISPKTGRRMEEIFYYKDLRATQG